MESKPSYGFIVGRFQVHALHDGHLELINLVRSMHKRVIIFLGVAPFKFTQSNPLDFIARKRMVEGKFPDVTCLPIYDVASDNAWSEELDRQIALVSNGAAVALYGGRDSFVPHYLGKHKPVELQLPGDHSGTKQRASISSQVLDSPEFRQGIIYAVHNRYPAVTPTVDIAIVDSTGAANWGDCHLILIRKNGEDGWRFPGGIVEPGDTAEVRAALEASEETGVAVGVVRAIGTFPIKDWRLKDDADSVLTTFFFAQYLYGAVKAGDDAAVATRWPIKDLKESHFVPEHRVLFTAFLKWYNNYLHEV